MATVDDAGGFALGLPEVTEGDFDGYAAVLIHLKKVGKRALREAIVDGWLACAPPKVVELYLQSKKRST